MLFFDQSKTCKKVCTENFWIQNFFINCQLYIILGQGFEGRKIGKILKYDTDNPAKNIRRKIENQAKLGNYRNFLYLIQTLIAISKNSVLEGRVDVKLCTHWI